MCMVQIEQIDLRVYEWKTMPKHYCKNDSYPLKSVIIVQTIAACFGGSHTMHLEFTLPPYDHSISSSHPICDSMVTGVIIDLFSTIFISFREFTQEVNSFEIKA